MEKIKKISIKTKLLIIIIPLLFCSFSITCYVSLVSSRKSLTEASVEFMKYKREEIRDYAGLQYQNFQQSSFVQNHAYEAIVKRSIESYIKNMIRNKSELIFALDGDGSFLFSSTPMELSEEEKQFLSSGDFNESDILSHFSLLDRNFVGIILDLPDFHWKIFILEDQYVFDTASRILTYKNIFAMTITLFLLIAGVIISLTNYIKPLRRVHDAIDDIIVNKDFSRKIPIEYPDEIGALAFDFNKMTTNLDLSYKKLKKYALDEAIAKKEVTLREEESLQVLGRASDYKDPETGAHILRVSNYSLLISRSLGQPEAIQDLLYKSSPLHDIGKLGIPDSILLKQEKLNEEEFSLIKTHTTMGHNILVNSSSKYLKAGAVIALSHHEHYDGSGYPLGLKGEDISILGRIVSVADVFDALTTKRPYKKPWIFEEAVDYIYESRNCQFDPQIVEHFMKILPEIREVQKFVDDSDI